MTTLRLATSSLLAIGLMAGCGKQTPTTPPPSPRTREPRPPRRRRPRPTRCPPHSASPPTSSPDPTVRCGSPRPARSGASPRPARSRSSRCPPATRPRSLTRGPDGALWFTEPANSAIGRITTSGAVTETKVPGACQVGYSCPTMPKPIGIVTGADGALWIIEPIFSRVVNRTSAAKLLRLTIGGTFTEFRDPRRHEQDHHAEPRQGGARSGRRGVVHRQLRAEDLARDHVGRADRVRYQPRRPERDRGGPGRRAVVHREPARSHHHRRRGQLEDGAVRTERRLARRRSPAEPTPTCGSPPTTSPAPAARSCAARPAAR